MELVFTILSTVLVQVGICLFCFIKKNQGEEIDSVNRFQLN